MKTLTKTFARRVISALLVTIMVFSLGIVGITSASAAEQELAETGGNLYSGAVIIYDNTDTKSTWTKSIWFVYGTSSYTQSSKMTNIPNTNLYYTDYYSAWENDLASVAIVSNDTMNPGSYNISSGVTGCYGYKNLFDASNYNFNNGSVYLFTPATSAQKGGNINVSPQINGYTDLNHQQNAKVAVQSGSSYAVASNSNAGTVMISGYGLNSDHKSTTSSYSTSYSVSFNACRGSEVTLTANPKTDYEFVGWSTTSSGSNIVSTSNPYTYTSQEHGKTHYALFKKAASISGVTADQNGLAIAGKTVTLDITYSLNNVTGESVKLYLGNDLIESVYFDGTLTFTAPETAGKYTYTVKVSGSDVEGSVDVAIDVLPVLNVGINGTPTSQYVGENITVNVLSATALSYGTDITYYLYCNGTEVDSNNTGEFKVTQTTADDYVYSGKVAVAGYEAETTENLTLTFNAKVFSIDTFTSSVGNTIDENRDFTLTATVKFATEGEEVKYYLIFPNGTEVDNTTGVFDIRSKNLDDGVTSEVVTYKIYATCGEATTAVKELQMTINEDSGTYPIKLLFKSSTVYGYQPKITVDGVEQTAVKETEIQTSDVAGHGVSTYAWYSFYTNEAATYNQQIEITFQANRAHYYNVTYVLEVGSDDHTSVDGVDYYYLAIENLNTGTDAEVYNLSHWPEAERNWTESAVNMVYNAGVDVLPVSISTNELVTTSFTYRFANAGDANVDGNVNIKDATFIQKTLAGITTADSLATFASDFNQDGKISIQDATAIQKQLAGL